MNIYTAVGLLIFYIVVVILIWKPWIKNPWHWCNNGHGCDTCDCNSYCMRTDALIWRKHANH